ncbi:phage portal protein [Magnetospirillum sp. 15-1]|uniref:phage portal protein n=1 Tax=Magnetospirillum sp. 15-1 TaxID=1979370 RepID=UPI000BBC58CF|nr:phage portal protein [Magnetospirillum sp. 15-1]
MSILDRLAGAIGYERRAADPSWSALSGGGTLASSGALVNARTSENLSTVLACVGAISSALASLPAYCYRVLPTGREEDRGHPVAKLTRRPNHNMTWPDWVEFTVSEVLRFGNALSVIETDGTGQPTALRPVPWQNVQVILLPSGRLAFDVIHIVGPFGGTGQPRRYLDSEVFHLKDRSDDGLLGRSRLSRAPEVLGNALGLQEYVGSMWANQATPGGVVKIASRLDQAQYTTLAARFNQKYAGTGNAKKTMILDNGADWQPMSVSPEDAEVLASRRFSVEELCRLFQVPPPIVQDYTHNTFTNSAQAALWFAQFSLATWATKIEAEFARSVFVDDTHRLEIDLSGLTRGDWATRWQAWKIATDGGILDANEIREMEGFNPRPVAAP